MQNAAKQETEAMRLQLDKVCFDADAFNVCLEFANQVLLTPSLLSPYEKYWLYTLIASAAEAWPKSSPSKQKAIAVQNALVKYAMVPFTYMRGDAEEKLFPQDSRVSILNWNVCFFNHNLSMLFGGVLPWKDRIGSVAQQLQNTQVDVICLQEVFSLEAGLALYNLLKKNYAHFYLNIGPKLCGFDPSALGIPSGLFVASKYPLKDPHFQAFNHQETPKNRGYGFFTIDLMDRGDVVARIASTHLQPGQTEEDKNYRKAQINAILTNLRTKDILGIPCFLCGDLNLERGGEEYKKLVQNFVNSDLGSNWTCCELRNYWWKAGQDVKRFIAFGLDVEWIDYFLHLKSGMQSIGSMTTTVIPVNHLKDPKSSLSDHQILITVLKLSKNEVEP